MNRHSALAITLPCTYRAIALTAACLYLQVAAAGTAAPPSAAIASPVAPAAAAAPAAPAKSPGSDTSTINDLANYQGDRVSFDKDIMVHVEGPDGNLIGDVCLPRKWRLVGGTSYTSNGTGGPPESGIRFVLGKQPDPKDRRPPPSDKAMPNVPGKGDSEA